MLIFCQLHILIKGLSSVLRPEESGRERMDYNFSCNLIAFGRKTKENQLANILVELTKMRHTLTMVENPCNSAKRTLCLESAMQFAAVQ